MHTFFELWSNSLLLICFTGASKPLDECYRMNNTNVLSGLESQVVLEHNSNLMEPRRLSVFVNNITSTRPKPILLWHFTSFTCRFLPPSRCNSCFWKLARITPIPNKINSLTFRKTTLNHNDITTVFQNDTFNVTCIFQNRFTNYSHVYAYNTIYQMKREIRVHLVRNKERLKWSEKKVLWVRPCDDIGCELFPKISGGKYYLDVLDGRHGTILKRQPIKNSSIPYSTLIKISFKTFKLDYRGRILYDFLKHRKIALRCLVMFPHNSSFMFVYKELSNSFFSDSFKTSFILPNSFSISWNFPKTVSKEIYSYQNIRVKTVRFGKWGMFDGTMQFIASYRKTASGQRAAEEFFHFWNDTQVIYDAYNYILPYPDLERLYKERSSEYKIYVCARVICSKTVSKSETLYEKCKETTKTIVVSECSKRFTEMLFSPLTTDLVLHDTFQFNINDCREWDYELRVEYENVLSAIYKNSFTITEDTPGGSYKFICSAFLKGDIWSTNVTYKVHREAHHFKIYPNNSKIVPGANVTCSAEGYPTPNVYWVLKPMTPKDLFLLYGNNFIVKNNLYQGSFQLRCVGYNSIRMRKVRKWKVFTFSYKVEDENKQKESPFSMLMLMITIITIAILMFLATG